MIQRIQSVYLGLIALISILLIFLPVVSMVPTGASGNTALYHLSYLRAQLISEGVESVLVWFWPLLIISIMLAGLALFVLMQYKNRKIQLRLTQLLFLFSIISIVVLVYEVDTVGKIAGPDYRTTFSVYAALPVLQLLFCRLAAGAIRKDEELVRSADRLR